MREVKEAWNLRYEGSTKRLYLTVQGHGTEHEAQRACQIFLDLLGKNTVDFVVDLGKMTGYVSEARRAWQECLFPVRSQLRRMLVVGEEIPGLVRMGVTVVAAFSGIPIRFFHSYAELEAHERRSVSPPPSA